MKASRKIRIRQLVISSGLMIIIAGLVVLCTPKMGLMAHEMDYSRHTGAYRGMAYVAEQEIRENQHSATVNNNEKIAVVEKKAVKNPDDAEQTKKGYPTEK
jgi:hypothetical protein